MEYTNFLREERSGRQPISTGSISGQTNIVWAASNWKELGLQTL